MRGRRACGGDRGGGGWKDVVRIGACRLTTACAPTEEHRLHASQSTPSQSMQSMAVYVKLSSVTSPFSCAYSYASIGVEPSQPPLPPQWCGFGEHDNSCCEESTGRLPVLRAVWLSTLAATASAQHEPQLPCSFCPVISDGALDQVCSGVPGRALQSTAFGRGPASGIIARSGP